MPEVSPALLPWVFGVWLAAYFRPWTGVTFVVAGSIPYYVLLDLMHLNTSGPLTGMVFGGSGLVAVSSLLFLKRRKVAYPLAVLLFGFFAFVWYLRWWQEPPFAGASGGSETFGQRAMIYMAVFATIPFFGAQLINTEDDFRSAVAGLAFWGGFGILILSLYWITGQRSYAPSWSGKWEPVSQVTGIVLASDVGTGCLALLAVTSRRAGLSWTVARTFLMGMAIALTVRIGERGPFLFLVLALGLQLLLRTRGRIRQVFSLAVAVAFLAVIALETADTYESERTVNVDRYTTEANQNRLTLVETGVRYAAQRPLVGWGGSLVGRPMGSASTWMYCHMTLLDPLIETGFLGAIACWLLYSLVLTGLTRRIRGGGKAAELASQIAPLLAYAMLENQVSGHISGARHMWFLASVSVVPLEHLHRLAPRSAARAAALIAPRQHNRLT